MDFVNDIFSRRNSIASISPIALRSFLSSQTLARTFFSISNSSFLVLDLLISIAGNILRSLSLRSTAFAVVEQFDLSALHLSVVEVRMPCCHERHTTGPVGHRRPRIGSPATSGRQPSRLRFERQTERYNARGSSDRAAGVFSIGRPGFLALSEVDACFALRRADGFDASRNAHA